MSTISILNDVDYRVIYVKQTTFEQRMRDVYIAKQAHNRPPFFDDLLEELMDIEALLLLEHFRHNRSLGEEYIDDLVYRIEKMEDVDAIHEVLSFAGPEFLALFSRDVYMYLQDQCISFIERDPYHHKELTIHNLHVKEVW